MSNARPHPSVLLLLAAVLGCGGGAGEDPTSASATIGAAGGSVALAGGPLLVVPAGALSSDTRLTVERTGQTAPGGGEVFRLGPAGTTFAQPVTVSLPAVASIAAPAVFWSKPASATAFDVVAAAVTAGGVEAQGTHFSTVFVGPSAGDGVCAAAGNGADGAACGGGRTCLAGACVARLSGTLSGAAVAGVTVGLTGAATATAVTDAAGRYAFDGLAAGSYTVTPSLEAYAFTPVSAGVVLAEESADGLDFAAWRPVVTAMTPGEGHVGSSVTISGEQLGAAGEGTVTLGDLPMEVVSWSPHQVVARVPSGATAGDVVVRVGTGASIARPFVVTATVEGLLVDGAEDPGLAGSWATPARLVVTAVGTGRAAVSASVPGSGHGGLPRTFSLELPLGTYTLAVEDLDGDGQPTLDLLQASTRLHPGVVVGEAGVSGLELPIRWHWEVHALDPGFPVCGFERQLHFRDAEHGLATFQVNADVDPAVTDPRIHGLAMATSDGGRTWSIVSHDMSSALDDFRPLASGWFPTGNLLTLDGGVALAAGEAGKLVRSEDAGATWSAASLNWAGCGPGGPSPTRFARAAGRLYVSVSTGGVQGSYERSQLLASDDQGLTWQRLFDVCNPNYTTPNGCPTQGVPLGFAGIDMACSDVHPGRCVTLGYEHDGYTSLVMVTQDGFQTFQTIASKCGYFTDGQVLWFPGTDTAWVVAASSCPGVGYQRLTTTDGGETWTDWAPSPVPGKAAFTDAQHGMSWWDWGVRRTSDGGASWRYTGRAPADGGALRTVHVLDAEHAWVLGHRDCRVDGAAHVARWVP